MKSLLPVLIACVSIAASAADTASLTGNWKVHNSIGGNESDMDCTFTQKDKDFAGSCKTDQGTVNITGKIADQKVNWIFKSEYNGGPITLTYDGKMDSSSKISGTVRVEEFSVDGDFTASLSK